MIRLWDNPYKREVFVGMKIYDRILAIDYVRKRVLMLSRANTRYELKYPSNLSLEFIDDYTRSTS